MQLNSRRILVAAGLLALLTGGQAATTPNPASPPAFLGNWVSDNVDLLDEMSEDVEFMDMVSDDPVALLSFDATGLWRVLHTTYYGSSCDFVDIRWSQQGDTLRQEGNPTRRFAWRVNADSSRLTLSSPKGSARGFKSIQIAVDTLNCNRDPLLLLEWN